MVAQLTIFGKGGLVLWSSNNDGKNPIVYTEPIDKLVKDVLLSDRKGLDSMQQDDLTLKWTLANNLDLVFVCVYFSFQKLLYVDDLLKSVKYEFIKLFENSLKGGIGNLVMQSYDFGPTYRKIINFYEKQAKKSKGAKSWQETPRGRDFNNFRSNGTPGGGGNSNIVKEPKIDSEGAPAAPASSGSDATRTASQDAGLEEFGDEFGKMKRIRSQGPKKFDESRLGRNKNKNKNKNKDDQNSNKKKKKKPKNGKKPGKQLRDWTTLGGTNSKKITADQIASLNLSSANIFDIDGDDKKKVEVDKAQQQQMFEKRNVDLQDSESEDDSDDEYVPHFQTSGGTDDGSGGDSNRSIWSRFTSLVSDRPLEESDVSGVLKEFENDLTNKNVANSIAQDICKSVASSLVGKQIGTFGSVKRTVKSSISDALTRILTPDKPVNILHGIATAREQKRPYTIVFIGVNGVGKSTTLSKVIYYLKSRGLQVSVAACDTFRSGAVEQLKTHCKALEVRLFDQGYAKDAASVAHSAIREASNTYHDDVVLVDTAGRMQNNEPLMRALVNLISKNQPDLVLFVGEALVGNDGVDQLIEFNRALRNLTTQKNPRLIDGIILTKFDACDDKVGAAISMTYRSGKPIVFLGTGQTYTDLKRAHVSTLINTLLK